jgi:ferredoxin/flavodoxin
MSAEIFYFSGTGNTLAVARDIAAGTGAKLTPIPSVMHAESIRCQADAVGIAFPIYFEPFGGVPLIVRRFISKLDGLGGKYIFSVCTYGTGSMITQRFLAALLRARGGRLAMRFNVNMPENMAAPKYNNPPMRQRMFDAWRKSADDVCARVNAGRKGRLDTPNILMGKSYALVKIFMPPLLPLFKPVARKTLAAQSGSAAKSYEELLPHLDGSFRVSDACTGCGACAKICPVGNIEIAGGAPRWLHRCEMCLACAQWCPNGAIACGAFPGMVRYRHPDVSLQEMMGSGGEGGAGRQ